MNKTIKEQAEAYYEKWILLGIEESEPTTLAEHIITEERKRRLPTKEEFRAMSKYLYGRDETEESEDTGDLYDWLLSYESEAVVEDEGKGEECRHQYSRAIQQLYPRLCLKCGKAEKVSESTTQPNDVNGTTFNEVGRMTYQPINRNELAEKIMIATCTRNSLQGAETIVQDVFRLADEFIKQAKS